MGSVEAQNGARVDLVGPRCGGVRPSRQLEFTGIDRGRAGESIGTGKRKQTCTALLQAVAACDRAG